MARDSRAAGAINSRAAILEYLWRLTHNFLLVYSDASRLEAIEWHQDLLQVVGDEQNGHHTEAAQKRVPHLFISIVLYRIVFSDVIQFMN